MLCVRFTYDLLTYTQSSEHTAVLVLLLDQFARITHNYPQPTTASTKY